MPQEDKAHHRGTENTEKNPKILSALRVSVVNEIVRGFTKGGEIMPGNQAIVNPAELRRFASDLKRFNEELKSSSTRLQAQFRRLGETWRDQEQARFAGEFDQMVRAIQRFTQVSDQHIPFLERKAQAADDYLRRR